MLGKILSYLSVDVVAAAEFAIEAYKLCYKLDCVTDIDYIYHYKVETKLKKFVKKFNAIGGENKDFELLEINDCFSLYNDEDQKNDLYDECHKLFGKIKEKCDIRGSIDLMKISSYIIELKKKLKIENEELLNNMPEMIKKKTIKIQTNQKDHLKVTIANSKIEFGETEKIN